MAGGTAALVSGGIGLLSSGAQFLGGKKSMKNAQKELNAYERQELNNAFKNIQVSTIGSDLMREEAAGTTASLVDASRNAGIRGILGGIPKIQAYNNESNQEARNYLDSQVQKRNYAIAEDDVRIRGVKENRDNANIAALSSQVEAGRQDMWNGIAGMAQSGMSLANSAFSGGSKTASDNSGNNVQSFGDELKTQGLAEIPKSQFSFSSLPKLASNDSAPSLFDDYGSESYYKNNRRKLF